jgi:long-chain acyl-CoA synthetase
MPDWWEQAPALHRVVSDLLAAELAQMRPGRPPPAPPWAGELVFARDLGVDSLELMGMGSALAEALHLQRADVDARLLARPALGEWVASARAGLAAHRGARAAPAPAALTFRTSGSAGTPKRCTHALATLLQEIDALAPLVPGRRRILTAVPSHHIYGFLFTVLLPQRLQIDAVIDVRSAAPAAVAGMARPGDLIVAHPAWWDALAGLDAPFGPDIVGVTSTAPCPDPLAARLGAAGLRLLQVYGSSETGGVGWREAAGAAFTLLPYWSRGTEEGRLVRTMPTGLAETFAVQDRLDWTDALHFRPGGRIDQAVQVGGVNVFPAYVADVLAMHPQVAAAAVRPMRPDEGSRLKAFVVASDGADADLLRAALPDWLAARLTAPERPAAYTFGAHLPRHASGKAADWIIDAG